MNIKKYFQEGEGNVKRAGYSFGYLLMCVYLYETDVYWRMGQEEAVTALLC